jgi:predicted metalloprotease with PDZ domain
VPLQQLDKHTWLAPCRGRSPLTVTWQVYAFDNSVRTAWLDSQRGFFNGTSTFLCPLGHEHRPCHVSLGPLPPGWDVATGLDVVPEAVAPQTYAAPDYDALIDHPFELGPFWRRQFEVCGVTHEFVVAGALPGFDGERLLADTRRICEAQIRFWHGEQAGQPGGAVVPFQRYVFMLNTVDDGYGGLEHRNSTALICNRRDLPRRGETGLGDGYVTLLGLISHEYFHTWNVKRMKPREFMPYRLGQENYTELLWFFEGFTSYYDDLFLLRTGLIEPMRYLRLLSKTLNQVLGTPGRQVQSVAQASFDAWVKYYRPDENSVNATVSYYTKGALVAQALDLTLRHEGRGSLDAVMQQLWRRSGGAAITEADIAAVLEAVGGRSYAPELAAWVHGTDDIPLEPLWQVFGVEPRRDKPTLAQRLGARLGESAAGVKVQAVLRGSAAEQAGLAAGDEWVALGDWRVQKLDDLGLIGAGFEQPLPLLASRDKRLLPLTLPALPHEGGNATLGLQAKPSAKAKQLQGAWWGLSQPQ